MCDCVSLPGLRSLCVCRPTLGLSTNQWMLIHLAWRTITPSSRLQWTSVQSRYDDSVCVWTHNNVYVYAHECCCHGCYIFRKKWSSANMPLPRNLPVTSDSCSPIATSITLLNTMWSKWGESYKKYSSIGLPDSQKNLHQNHFLVSYLMIRDWFCSITLVCVRTYSQKERKENCFFWIWIWYWRRLWALWCQWGRRGQRKPTSKARTATKNGHRTFTSFEKAEISSQFQTQEAKREWGCWLQASHKATESKDKKAIIVKKVRLAVSVFKDSVVMCALSSDQARQLRV